MLMFLMLLQNIKIVANNMFSCLRRVAKWDFSISWSWLWFSHSFLFPFFLFPHCWGINEIPLLEVDERELDNVATELTNMLNSKQKMHLMNGGDFMVTKQQCPWHVKDQKDHKSTCWCVFLIHASSCKEGWQHSPSN